MESTLVKPEKAQESCLGVGVVQEAAISVIKNIAKSCFIGFELRRPKYKELSLHQFALNFKLYKSTHLIRKPGTQVDLVQI